MQQNCQFGYLTEILRLHTSFNFPPLATLVLGTLEVGKPEWTLRNTVAMGLCRAQSTL